MQELSTLRVDQLADLLNKETTRYYTLIGDKKYANDIINSRKMIQEIQKEIDNRKKKLYK